MLCDVTEPEPVQLGWAELSLHQILVRRCVRFPTAPFAAVGDVGEAVEAHEAGDSLPADMNAEPEPQLGLDPRRTVGASRVAVNLSDRRRQRLVRVHARRRRSAPPVVEAGGRDVQEPAGHRDGNTLRGELLDQPEPHFGGTFSLAK